MADKRPVRKVAAAGLGGVPLGAGALALIGWLWPALPEPAAGAIGALVAAGVGYFVPSAPHEKVHKVPDAP